MFVLFSVFVNLYGVGMDIPGLLLFYKFCKFVSIIRTMFCNIYWTAQKFQSGAQKRKQVKKKKENLQEIFSKTQKNASYFSVSPIQQFNDNVTASTSCGSQLFQNLNVNDSTIADISSLKTSSSVLETGYSLNDMRLKKTLKPEETTKKNDNNYKNNVGLWRRSFSDEMIFIL